MMKKILAMTGILVAVYAVGAPAISFAQECGGWFGTRCPAGQTCMTTENGIERPARVERDEAGTCKSPVGNSTEGQAKPNLPVWFGTEDNAATPSMPQPPRRRNAFSWLASAFTPTPSAVKDQCAKPGATTCTLTVNGISQFGLCTKSPTSGNKICTPAAYARAPQAAPAVAYVPGAPSTFDVPCTTNPNKPASEGKNNLCAGPRYQCSDRYTNCMKNANKVCWINGPFGGGRLDTKCAAAMCPDDGSCKLMNPGWEKCNGGPNG